MPLPGRKPPTFAARSRRGSPRLQRRAPPEPLPHPSASRPLAPAAALGAKVPRDTLQRVGNPGVHTAFKVEIAPPIRATKTDFKRKYSEYLPDEITQSKVRCFYRLRMVNTNYLKIP